MTKLTAAVITSSTGRQWLPETIEAIRAQTYPCTHYVYINGGGFQERAAPIMARYPDVVATYLPGKGGNVKGVPGPEGVYAAAAFLADADVLFFCNDDDVYTPDHVESLMTLIEERDLEWAYSLRTVVNIDGETIADDNCESLGYWPAVYGDETYLVDCSSYAVRRELAVRVAPGWYFSPVGDRVYLASLKIAGMRAGCTGRHTVRYRLQPHGGINSKFIEDGNARMAKRWPEGFPWHKVTQFLRDEPGSTPPPPK